MAINTNKIAEMLASGGGSAGDMPTIMGVAQQRTAQRTENAANQFELQEKQKVAEAEAAKKEQAQKAIQGSSIYLDNAVLFDPNIQFKDQDGDGIVDENDTIREYAMNSAKARMLRQNLTAEDQMATKKFLEVMERGNIDEIRNLTQTAVQTFDQIAAAGYKEYEPYTSAGISRRGEEYLKKKKAGLDEQRLGLESKKLSLEEQKFAASQQPKDDIRTLGNNLVRVNTDGTTDVLFDGSGGKGGGYVLYDESGNVQGTGSLEELSAQVKPGWQLSKPPTIDPTKMGQSDVKDPTADQRTAATFATRVTDANKVIESVGADRVGTFDQINLSPERFKTEESRQYNQAARNFINTVLRRESGAVIGESEFENAQLQYLPQPGDGPKVIEQKRRNRMVVQAGLTAEAGDVAMQELQDNLAIAMQDPTKVMVNGKLMNVGDQVTGQNGQTGVVQADGTIKVVQ